MINVTFCVMEYSSMYLSTPKENSINRTCYKRGQYVEAEYGPQTEMG